MQDFVNLRYPDRIMETFSVIPSPKVSDTVVEPHLVFHAISVLRSVRTVWMGLQVEQHAGSLSK